MSKPSTAKASADPGDAPLRKADIAGGALVRRRRAGSGAVLPNKQRINIYLDGAVIEHFKAKAKAGASFASAQRHRALRGTGRRLSNAKDSRGR